jgi:membrane-associated phospholipid phosphatase
MINIFPIDFSFISWVQSFGPWLLKPMLLFSFLGTENFYILVIPAIYWCFDSILGIRIGIMLVLTSGFNTIFKFIFHSPRPYWLKSTMQAHYHETSFGAPSGHAQNAASIWGLLGSDLSRRSPSIKVFGITMPVFSAIILIFIIGFSRIYLGVHFTIDVLLGWFLGLLLLLVFLRLEKPIAQWFRDLSLMSQIGIAFLSSFIFFFSGWLIISLQGSWKVPLEWVQNALMIAPKEPINPFNLEGMLTIGGIWFGLISGASWLFNKLGKPFDASGSEWQRLVRYIVGTIGVFILWYGLGSIFPRTQNFLGFSLRYLRYTLVGVWVAALAPLLFIKIKLANR